MTSTAIFGDPTTGPDGGEGTLASAATETLCLRVTMPVTSDNAYQAQSTVATFALEAEQTAHNP
jgi:hypothetical protein